MLTIIYYPMILKPEKYLVVIGEWLVFKPSPAIRILFGSVCVFRFIYKSNEMFGCFTTCEDENTSRISSKNVNNNKSDADFEFGTFMNDDVKMFTAARSFIRQRKRERNTHIEYIWTITLPEFSTNLPSFQRNSHTSYVIESIFFLSLNLIIIRWDWLVVFASVCHIFATCALFIRA